MTSADAPSSAPGLHADISTRAGKLRITADLRIAPGETVALLGPNGAGKSTLLHAIAGLCALESGRVSLNGRVLEDTRSRIRVHPSARRCGVVFQDARLFPWLTALDNAAYGARSRGLPRARARALARDWLDRLGVRALEHRRARALSGGESQRIAIARALAMSPSLLLLDEPLAALDLHARPLVRRVLAQALADLPYPRLLVTHDPVDALTLATRIVILENGRVTQTGAPDDIRAHPRSAYAAAFIGLNAFRGVVRSGEGVRFLESGAWRIAIADDAIPDGAPALLTLAPGAVTLALSEPAGSARNRFRGAIRSITIDRSRVRASLDTAPPLIAEITEDARRELDLHEGAIVWASFKASETHIEAI